MTARPKPYSVREVIEMSGGMPADLALNCTSPLNGLYCTNRDVRACQVFVLSSSGMERFKGNHYLCDGCRAYLDCNRHEYGYSLSPQSTWVEGMTTFFQDFAQRRNFIAQFGAPIVAWLTRQVLGAVSPPPQQPMMGDGQRHHRDERPPRRERREDYAYGGADLYDQIEELRREFWRRQYGPQGLQGPPPRPRVPASNSDWLNDRP